MSGGTFEYKQSNIQFILEQLTSIMDNDGSYDAEYTKKLIDKHPEFKDDLNILKDILTEAYIRVQRLDWLLAADDGYDTYRKRLTEEITKYYMNKPKQQ
jgi:hypothetical protein